jgi:hypothetical protein
MASNVLKLASYLEETKSNDPYRRKHLESMHFICKTLM